MPSSQVNGNEPRGFFAGIARLTTRFKWPVLIAYAVALALFGVIGAGVFSALNSEGFGDPGSDSARAAIILTDDFGARSPAVVLGVETATAIDSPESFAAAEEYIDGIAAINGVESVVSYWTSGQPEQLRSSDDRTGQVLVYTEEDADLIALGETITSEFSGDQGELIVYPFGGAVIGNEFTNTITGDLARAEAIAIPITIVLLLFVFGSVVSAGLPFLVAAGSILGSFFVLFIITKFTEGSVFALNLITGLGLALGIDYSLLMINRFREELAKGATTDDAVFTTVRTAGKTVLVSGITVAITLASLLFFPQFFLKSFAYAGISVSLLAVVGSLTALPALLAILGPRVNKWKVRRGDLAPKDSGAWANIARFVMKRPWPVLIATIAVLLVVASPALNAVFGQVDDRALPSDSPVAQAGEVLRDRFPGQEGAPYEIVLTNAGNAAAVDAYAAELSEIPGVVRVITPDSVIVGGVTVAPNSDPGIWTVADSVRISVTGDVPPIDQQGAELVDAIRAVDAPADEALVAGVAAEFADSTAGILDNVWIIALWIAITTLIILFLFTGSVLLPIKALLLNLLSLSATLGALVWVFQGNHLSWLTGDYISTGTIDISSIALVAVVAFALSMDYELFLLSRIKEEHDAGKNTEDAVAFGLQRTGRIITAAALLIAIVFASFLSSGVTNIKQLGFGVTFAILVDATVVRGLLVPAFMRIAGGANWWAPAWLRRIHNRVGLREE